MKNNKEIIEEFRKQYDVKYAGAQPFRDMAEPIEEFIERALTERTKEIEKKIWDILEIEVGDMPAFPPKDTDLISLSLIIGKEKIKRKRTEDIKKEIMARKIDVIYT